jgi:hypothetical protein
MSKKIVIRSLIGLAVVVVGLVVIIAMQPSQFQVSRSIAIKTPPAAPFAQVNDFHKWTAWSPWEKIDPGMKRTYEGPESGTGAIYGWEGNGDVGSGRMAITESKPDELIKIKLEFFTPMEGICPTEFSFKPEGEQTKVTWTMSGEHNFIGKALCLFMSMDKMIGDKFEEGLANMKKVVESGEPAENTPPAEKTADGEPKA